VITLYHAPHSRSTRMIWLLEELGQPYAIHPVSIFRPMTGEGAPDPANPHPDKRVPAIDHDGTLVAESLAIVLYLTDAFPGAQLGPVAGDAGRGAYLTWLAWYATELEPVLFAGLAGELDGSPHKRRSYKVALQRLETALARGPFVMGQRFSGADFLISPRGSSRPGARACDGRAAEGVRRKSGETGREVPLHTSVGVIPNSRTRQAVVRSIANSRTR
jgi:glutathione S-transferase